jgi:hypothetical protein
MGAFYSKTSDDNSNFHPHLSGKLRKEFLQETLFLKKCASPGSLFSGLLLNCFLIIFETDYQKKPEFSERIRN